MMSTQTDMIHSLGTAQSRAVTGGKGSGLSQLIEHGLPVPGGCVIAAEALPAALAESGKSLEDPGDLSQLSVPAPLLDALMKEIEKMGVDEVAVRSSAIDEDGAAHSFAGQYESVLSVPASDPAAVAEAVRHVWSSLFSAHAVAYRRAKSEKNTTPPSIAVVVQKMVDADLSGVLFTVDPVGQGREVMVVNVVRGLGDKLVSGEVTPEEYRIERHSGGTTEERGGSLLSHDMVTSLRDLALRIEEITGAPQDIEFAIRDGEVSILQARPITSLAPQNNGSDRLEDVEPVPVERVVPEEGFWELSSKDFQRPVTPLTTDIYFPAITGAIASFFQEFGIMLDGMDLRNIGGHPYVRMVPPGGKEGAPPPPFLMKILFRVVPFLRAKRKAARRATEENLVQKYVDRWYATDRPDLLNRLATFRSRDLTALTEEELLTLLEETSGWLCDGLDAHFLTLPAHFLAVSDLYTFAEKHFGWSKEKIGQMVSGISDETSAGTQILGHMAQLARRASGSEPVDRARLESLRRTDERFQDLHDEYFKKCGLILRTFDFDSPVDEENRDSLFDQVLAYIASGYDPDAVAERLDRERQAVREEAQERARELGEERVSELQQIFDLLETGMPIRDDTGMIALQAMGAIRLIAIELGRRLAERSLIARPQHVVYLSREEIVEGIRNKREWSETVALRRGQRKWAEMNPGPHSYGKDPGGPPPVGILPKEMHRIMGGLIWIIQNDLNPTIPTDDEGGINGIPASAGLVTGPVRVVRDPSSFGEVEPGEILVCPVTTPAWAGIFPVIGGIISDAGGILSHPAIIAREFGIPAIVGTGSATTTLNNGDIVRMNGTTGRVEIVERGARGQG